MNRLLFWIVTASLITLAPSADASLFTYNFKGVIDQSQVSEAGTGGSFEGTLTFDPAAAQQPFPNLSLFSLPAQITGHVGDFSFNNTLSGGAVIFSENTIFFDTFGGTIGNAQGTFSNNMDVVLTGNNLFAQVPASLADLQNVKWENASSGVFDFNLPGYNPPESSSIHGSFTSIAFGEGGGDAAPVPDPASLTTLGVGLMSWALFRRKNRKTRRDV